MLLKATPLKSAFVVDGLRLAPNGPALRKKPSHFKMTKYAFSLFWALCQLMQLISKALYSRATLPESCFTFACII